VKEAIGLSKTCIYEMVKGKTFPAPVPLGKRAVGWIEEEVKLWAAEQIRLRALDQLLSHKRVASETGDGKRLLRKTA
jgi:predicted DNA-binding transcriptional regulator AlpA